LRSFYRKLNRWGFFVLREVRQQQQPNQQCRQLSSDAAPSQFQVGALDLRSNGVLRGGLGGAILQPRSTLAAAPARAHGIVNNLGNHCGTQSTAKQAVWHRPDFYHSRAVECLVKAKKTGESGVFLTVIRPCTKSNACRGDDDGSGGHRCYR
jgi:hypothetical protein